MSAYNIIVNDVKKSKNKILCLVRIDNYKNMLKHVSIGESIRSEPIQMNFHDSIGKSSWTLIYYPKGQYVGSSDSNVMESGRASIYLKMIECENQDDSLAMIVKVFIKSPYSDSNDEFSTTKSAKLSYRTLNERWTGPFNLADIDELNSKRCKNLFLNDSLTIGCELNDTTFLWRVTPRSMIERSPVTASRYSSDAKYDAVKGNVKYSSIVGTESRDAPQSVPRLRSKGSRLSEISSNCGVKVEPAKRKKNPGQRSTSAFRNDVLKENENVCRCGQPDQKISRETQTWNEKLLLRSFNKNVPSKEADAEQLSHRDKGFCVKDAIEFFEKCSIRD